MTTTDPTQPLPTTETCPRGHVLSIEQVIIRDGRKVCPLCEQEAQGWAPQTRRRFWSRQLLRVPLMVVAGGALGLAIGSAFGIAANASLTGDVPGATAALIGSIFETLGELALTVAAAWGAYLIGLEDPAA
jgi:hypothetical protein